MVGVCSSSFLFHKMNQTRLYLYACESLLVCVMLKMQTSHDLQYIALWDEGGWRDETRSCRGKTDTNPLLANWLSHSPELDRERRRAGGRLTQNLSCWDYLIEVNHWFIVEFPPDVFPEDAGPWQYSFPKVWGSYKPAEEWTVMSLGCFWEECFIYESAGMLLNRHGGKIDGQQTPSWSELCWYINNKSHTCWKSKGRSLLKGRMSHYGIK